jgi:hypothetical protein
MTAPDLLDLDRPSDPALHHLARMQTQCPGSWAGKEHTCQGEDEGGDE